MAPISPRLRDFLRRWLRETVKPNLSPTTTKNHEMFGGLHIVPYLGNRPLDKIMVRDVQVWVNALRTRCQCCAQGKDAARPVSPCCAAVECCHEVASDWTIHQAWRVLRGASTRAMGGAHLSQHRGAPARAAATAAKAAGMTGGGDAAVPRIGTG